MYMNYIISINFFLDSFEFEKKSIQLNKGAIATISSLNNCLSILVVRMFTWYFSELLNFFLINDLLEMKYYNFFF